MSDLIECIKAPEQKRTECVVAMSVYRGDNPDWVKEAIDSIKLQSFSDFILLIVIDGPISEKLQGAVFNAVEADTRIGIFKSEVNRGLSAAMNFAVDWSKSVNPRLFFRMDADDISHSHRIQTQYDFMMKHNGVHVLGSSLFEIDETGRQVGKRVLPKSHEKIRKMIFTRCPLNHPTVCIRYDVFNSGIRYSENLMNTQDYFLWITLMKANYKFANLRKPLLSFRRVNNFYKRRGVSKSINEFRARRAAMRELQKYRLRYFVYALSVLFIRMLPSPLVRLAYSIDRLILRH
ncbi:glycosyltransferase [Agaribacter marinus]|uniref:Glycosyl transferase n=1 Tax=Agaribacter marinus TaxID=1431249 RepID=A0AA37T321_9ALTE|nr:glycosyltransferase [Agaribacter marinus]GLR70855.1 glycosyl transferase [Agaribacter marinus]